jgi:hypothetical protein
MAPSAYCTADPAPDDPWVPARVDEYRRLLQRIAADQRHRLEVLLDAHSNILDAAIAAAGAYSRYQSIRQFRHSSSLAPRVNSGRCGRGAAAGVLERSEPPAARLADDHEGRGRRLPSEVWGHNRGT